MNGSTQTSDQSVAYNGQPGAFAEAAAQALFPAAKTLPCPSFADAIAAVQAKKAACAVLPIENSLTGRVMDVHHLLPESGLHMVGEYFLPIQLQLLAPAGVALKDVHTIISHEQALAQCRKLIQAQGWRTRTAPNTTQAARHVAQQQEAGVAAIASHRAAEVFRLNVLQSELQDASHNTTRFVVMASEDLPPAAAANIEYITAFLFRVRHIPAALYKALGGFATNGVNLLKLESYLTEGEFVAAQFYVESQGHWRSPAMQNALEELQFFTQQVEILGCYPAAAFRQLDKPSPSPNQSKGPVS